jgi:hypothetical protein
MWALGETSPKVVVSSGGASLNITVALFRTATRLSLTAVCVVMYFIKVLHFIFF